MAIQKNAASPATIAAVFQELKRRRYTGNVFCVKTASIRNPAAA
jgi:hypothetical protein